MVISVAVAAQRDDRRRRTGSSGRRRSSGVRPAATWSSIGPRPAAGRFHVDVENGAPCRLVGSDSVTRGSKRPGLSSAVLRHSGRFVAARPTTARAARKLRPARPGSGSASLAPPWPPPSPCRAVGCSDRSRRMATGVARAPSSSSTKINRRRRRRRTPRRLRAEVEEERHVGLAAQRPRQQVSPVPAGPISSTPARTGADLRETGLGLAGGRSSSATSRCGRVRDRGTFGGEDVVLLDRPRVLERLLTPLVARRELRRSAVPNQIR